MAKREAHGLNADNTYAVASCRYISSKCVRNRWWFVVISVHVIRGPSSRVVTRVIMRRRIHGHVIRWAVILKLPDDHKTVPIGIYHLGAYYRRVNPGGWKQRRVKGPMSRKLDDNFTQALTSNRWLLNCISAFYFLIPLMMPVRKLNFHRKMIDFNFATFIHHACINVTVSMIAIQLPIVSHTYIKMPCRQYENKRMRKEIFLVDLILITICLNHIYE